MRTTWEFWKYYKLQKSNNRSKPMPKWLDASIFTEMDWWSQQNKIVQWIPFQSFFSFEPTGSLIKQTSKVTIKISFLPSCPVFLSLPRLLVPQMCCSFNLEKFIPPLDPHPILTQPFPIWPQSPEQISSSSSPLTPQSHLSYSPQAQGRGPS